MRPKHVCASSTYSCYLLCCVMLEMPAGSLRMDCMDNKSPRRSEWEKYRKVGGPRMDLFEGPQTVNEIISLAPNHTRNRSTAEKSGQHGRTSKFELAAIWLNLFVGQVWMHDVVLCSRCIERGYMKGCSCAAVASCGWLGSCWTEVR